VSHVTPDRFSPVWAHLVAAAVIIPLVAARLVGTNPRRS